MSSVEAAGIQALTVAGGVQVVCNSSAAGSFAVFIDASPLTTVDQLKVEILRKLRATSTLRAVYAPIFLGVDQDLGVEPVYFTIVPSAGFQFVVQLTLVAGAGTRNIEYSIERV